MKYEFEAGDVVRLKSGGPAMTVTDVGTGYVATNWFAGTARDREDGQGGTLQSGTFSPAVLHPSGPFHG